MNGISYYGIAYLLIFILPTLLINRKLDIAMNRQIIFSIVRMVLQLSLVGLYLQYIFDLNSQILNVCYMFIMMLVASISVIKSSALPLKRLFFPLFISMLIPNFILIIFFNKFVISLSNIFDARYIITIGGMLLGNVLNGDIIGLSAFYKGIGENQKQVNYELALGATHFQALKPFFKSAIEASIKPTAASMANVGLVSLPGMMTGQILGGSVPMEAILYQIGIMGTIYVARYFNIFGAIILSQKTMFDDKNQLRLQ